MREDLRATARSLVEKYRAKRRASDTVPARDEIAEKLAEDRALWFDLTLTDEDAAFLRNRRIDPCL